MPGKLQKGRESYRRGVWAEAYGYLSAADRAARLGSEDLERLAISAYLTGREPEFHRYLERAYHAWLGDGHSRQAAHCAFWLALTLLFRGAAGQAGGWLGRARRLVEGEDCVEQGYLLLPLAEQELENRKTTRAGALAGKALEIGERFGDGDLVACARHVSGRVLLQQHEIQRGLALLDETMLAVISGELTPMMTGLMYCSVIAACQQVYALSRAREWTGAFAEWCRQNSQMVAFTATCLVHRAEILQLSGDWGNAMMEADRACQAVPRRDIPAEAFYRQAELYRLRGEFRAAEEAYRSAARLGREPQPGLALLRMAQGRSEAACAAIRRAAGAAADPLRRAGLLPALIEILLSAGEIQDALEACRELHEIAEALDTDVLRAMAAQARGAAELAGGDARAALAPSRRAFELWRQAEAPFEAARVRVLIGRACRALGDSEACDLEFEAARVVFEQLGAAPQIADLDSLSKGPPGDRQGLSPRELQVLRMIASGMTNKAIAAELRLSERTIDRHVSNMLSKLDVPSRVAATAYAYESKLL